MALDPDLVDHRLIEFVCHHPAPFIAVVSCTGSVAARGYRRTDTKVGFGGIVMNRLRLSGSGLAGTLTFRLQQAQLAGARYGFGAPPDLEFAKYVPVVSFDGDYGEEEPLADFPIREPLGDEL